MADMLAWSLFLLYLHMLRLVVGGFIVKKDTHFGTFLYQNRCPDMAGALRLELRTRGFGDHCSTN